MVQMIGCAAAMKSPDVSASPFLIVLGAAQDAGSPQAGSFDEPGWEDATKVSRASCLGIVDPRSGKRWMIEATPDFRSQLYDLHIAADGESKAEPSQPLSGVFLTHAHIGHYTGLMFLGHESMGARGVPVYAAARMTTFLSSNGPWSQLVQYGNITLTPLVPGQAVELAPDLHVTPMLVPHRQEYSEVLAFVIEGPNRSVLFLPDIDSWKKLDEWDAPIEDLLKRVDVAYVDGTFFDDGEIPDRDMSGFPHPRIRASISRFSRIAPDHRPTIRFIHLNHTNPAQYKDSAERRETLRAGFFIAHELERLEL